MGGYATGGEGFWSNPLGSIKSLASEAWSGNLSDIDKQNILNDANVAIAKASGGADPGTILANQTAAAADINAALDSFSVAGDSGGAQPSNDLRLPAPDWMKKLGLNTLSPATLEWVALGVGVLIIGAVAFPYVAPLIVSNVRAGRSVHAAAS